MAKCHELSLVDRGILPKRTTHPFPHHVFLVCPDHEVSLHTIYLVWLYSNKSRNNRVKVGGRPSDPMVSTDERVIWKI
jgi:hypothetical protein